MPSRLRRWLAVVLALALLTWLWLYQRSVMRGADTERTRGDLRAFATALEVYRALNGFYPSTAQGLDALCVPPASSPAPDPSRWRKLMDSAPLDPWGRPYRYRFPSRADPERFEVFSVGPDGREDTADDVRYVPQPSPTPKA